LQFCGVHIDNIRERFLARERQKSLEALIGEKIRSPKIEIVTGIIELDALMQSLMTFLARKHVKGEKFIKANNQHFEAVIAAARQLLAESGRDRNGVFNIYGYKIKGEYKYLFEKLSILINALHKEFAEECATILNHYSYEKDRNELTTVIDRLVEKDRIKDQPTGVKRSMHDTLQYLYEYNDKQINSIKTAGMTLGALSFPAIAVLYQALGALRFYPNSGIRFLVLAVSLHFVATLSTLMLWFVSLWGIRKIPSGDKIIIPDDNNFDSHNPNVQSKYIGIEEVFLYRMYERAPSHERVHANDPVMSDSARLVTRTAKHLRCLKRFMLFVLCLYGFALLLYGIAASCYFFAWRP